MSDPSRYRTAVHLAVLLVAGCAVLDPVNLPKKGSSNILALPQPANVPSHPDGAAAPPHCDGAKCYAGFAGGLGEAIAEMDERRLQLTQLGADVVNTTATYNALLWPIGAAVLYQRMVTPSYSLLLPAAVAAGSYGFMASGVSDRDKHYLATARQLGCQIVDASVDLYKTVDLSEAATKNENGNRVRAQTRGGVRLPGLYRALDDLQEKIETYAENRDTQLSALVLERPKAAPSSGLTLDEFRRQNGASPKAGTAAPKDSRTKILDAAGREIARARATKKSGDEMRRRIDDSGLRLRARWSAVEASAQEQLSSRVPPPQDPRVVAGRIAELIGGMAAAQADAVRDDDAAFDPAWLDGLDKASRDKVIAFIAATRKLQAATANVQGWLDDDAARRKSVDGTLASMNCKAGDLTVVVLPSVQAPSASAPAGTRPATALTPPTVTTLPTR